MLCISHSEKPNILLSPIPSETWDSILRSVEYVLDQRMDNISADTLPKKRQNLLYCFYVHLFLHLLFYQQNAAVVVVSCPLTELFPLL